MFGVLYIKLTFIIAQKITLEESLMKLLKLTSFATLSAIALLSGTTALAEQSVEGPVEGIILQRRDATATFRAATDEDNDGGLIVVPPPGPQGPDDGNQVEIEPDGDDNKLPFAISKIPHLNFGTQTIPASPHHYDVIAERHFLKDEDGNTTQEHIPYISFLQVIDARGTNAGWNVDVHLSEFTAKDTLNDKLKGASILFNDSVLQYVPQVAEQSPKLSFNDATLEIHQGGAPTPFMNANAGQGAGTTNVLWGDYDQLQADDKAGIDPVTHSGIQLYVPGTHAIDATSYEATMTWRLQSGPVANHFE